MSIVTSVRWFILAACATLLVGCAHRQKHEPEAPPEPESNSSAPSAFAFPWSQPTASAPTAAEVSLADADVPDGKGWYCFSKTKRGHMLSLCERTRETCSKSARRELNEGAVVSVCKPASDATCYFVDYDPSKSGALFASGPRRKVYGCFGDREECTEIRGQNFEHASAGDLAFSTCRTLR